MAGIEELDMLVDQCRAEIAACRPSDVYGERRLGKLLAGLEQFDEGVKSGTYPRDLTFLPLLHYVERHMDPVGLYRTVQALDTWYVMHYRQPGREAVRRERVKAYLMSGYGFSEQQACGNIAKLAKHADIYLEFAGYVESGTFPEDGVTVLGYSARELNEAYPLSVLGAYNYLVYLREMPEQALDNLKHGLPRK